MSESISPGGGGVRKQSKELEENILQNGDDTVRPARIEENEEEKTK